MEIRGQELKAAATAGVDATCRAAGKEGLMRDIPRRFDRGFPSAARLRAEMVLNDDTAPDAFAVAKAPVLSSPAGLSISILKML